jgi:hypothetical protein
MRSNQSLSVPRSVEQLLELSRADLRRLRRGELSAEVVSAWMEKTRGLAAPAPPRAGDLVENGTGWLVGTGRPDYRYAPRVWRVASAAAAGLGAQGNLWAMLLGLHHPSLALVMSLGLGPALASFGAAVASTRWRIRRRFDRAHFPGRLSDTAPGTSISLAGTVAEQPAVPTLFRGVPAVLFRNRIGAADETRGIDFWLTLDDGQSVRIAVREAILVDTPLRTREPPACGPVKRGWFVAPARLESSILRPALWTRARYESAIAPGDRVEVCGVLHREATETAGPFDRQLPVISVLRAAKGAPLLVRSLIANAANKPAHK